MSEFQELLENAIDIADEASRVAASYFRQALLIEIKENQTPVTVADKKTEEIIRREIETRFPDHGIVGEEFGEKLTTAEYVWTIDPIDGTRSFIRGIPLFGTLVGVLKQGEPVVGVMILPALNEMYSGAKGLGTYCNGTQVHVSNTTGIESSIVSVGDIASFHETGQRKFLDSLNTRAALVRGYTDCFGHALVIRGSIDAMVDPLISPWDVAPIACLIQEAGGHYFTFEGEKTHLGKSFLTCNAHLKSQLLALALDQM